MQISALFLISVCFFPLAGLGASFFSSFPSVTYPYDPDGVSIDLDGLDGWEVSDPGFLPNPSPLAFVAAFPGGSEAAGLGGYYDGPLVTATTVNLTHAAQAGLQFAEFETDFQIVDSSAPYPDRDSFGFALFDSNQSNLFAVKFIPTTALNTVTNQIENAYQTHFQVGSGALAPAKTSGNGDIFIFPGGAYSLSLTFGRNGVNPSFTGVVSSLLPSSLSFSGVATGLGFSEVEYVGASWTTIGDGGSNYLVFDNISLVPEPSSAVLAIAGVMGFALRRRRD